MSHFDNMAAWTEAQFPLMFQVMYTAVILLTIDGDNACEFYNLLKSGLNFWLFGIGRTTGWCIADSCNVQVASDSGWGSIWL